MLHVELREPPIPPDAWAAYEAVTRSHACTKAFIDHFDHPASPELAFVRAAPGGPPLAAFVFVRDGRGTAALLDRYADPPAEVLEAFAEAVFERHPEVVRIRTELIDAPGRRRPGTRPRLVLREDRELRVPIPARVEAYDRVLGKKLVRECRSCERRLDRLAPGWAMETVEGPALSRALVAEIARLHRARLAARGVESAIDAFYEEGIHAVASRHGCATVLRAGGRVLAGVVHVCRGEVATAWMLGFDAAYAACSPGKLVMIAGARHLVAHGVTVCRFLLGDAAYKRQLGGQPFTLGAYLVLRSWRAVRPLDLVRAARGLAARLARRVLRGLDPVRQALRALAPRLRRA
ncbi:MAG: GNAT family N-acetyltransferase [Anaeromyxobacteraceae bacterium]